MTDVWKVTTNNGSEYFRTPESAIAAVTSAVEIIREPSIDGIDIEVLAVDVEEVPEWVEVISSPERSKGATDAD